MTPEKWANHVMGLLNTRFGPSALGTSMAVKETIADAVHAAVAEAVATREEEIAARLERVANSYYHSSADGDLTAIVLEREATAIRNQGKEKE